MMSAESQTWSILHEMAEEGAKAGGELNDLNEEACGLVSNHPDLTGIIESLQGMRVLPRPVRGSTGCNLRIKTSDFGTRDHMPGCAMDEAFKCLRPMAPMNQRV